MTATQARQDFAETVNRVAYRGERVVLERRGKPLAAIIPVQDLEILEKLEDRLDLEAARAALAKPGTVPWKKVKKELGL
jgi:prevent-host-death family protein